MSEIEERIAYGEKIDTMEERMTYMERTIKPIPVLQEWVQRLTFMQQSVLIAAVRGPDGVEKNHAAKAILRWYRRCVLYSAFESMKAGRPTRLTNPAHPGGGSFTGPSVEVSDDGSDPFIWRHAMAKFVVPAYIDSLDALPHHYQLHMMHAAEIVGYKHDLAETREWWAEFYLRLVRHLHLLPETVEGMDKRLGDFESSWREAEK